MSAEAPQQQPDGTQPSIASARWVIAVAVGISLAVALFALWGPLRGMRPPIGDGRDPSTYGFDLSNLQVPRELLVGSGQPRDFLKPLDDPKTITGSEVAPRNAAERQKYAVSTDRVVGVMVGGETRAYPLQLLNVHEVVHDTIGGVPIAVTYSPLCDSAVVFDRRLDGRVLRFGISGLLLSNNLVMYDAPPDAGADSTFTPSLWSQLAFRAIAGPAASKDLKLTVVGGTQLCTWAAWLLLHPDTTIALPPDGDRRRMKGTDYERYWIEGKVQFPVGTIPPTNPSDRSVPFAEIAPTVAPLLAQGLGDMALVIAVQRKDGWRVLPVAQLAALVDPNSMTADAAALGVRARWRVVPQRGALIAEWDSTVGLPVMVPCRWFAWQAFHPFVPAAP
ncbi:MAG: DUF3179 domain-containing protein [Planctomycetes bacterium]|nr:DUF3179 domain-containing protein [Planctomycetota bacterium]